MFDSLERSLAGSDSWRPFNQTQEPIFQRVGNCRKQSAKAIDCVSMSKLRGHGAEERRLSPHGMHEVQVRVLLVLHGPVQALLTRSWYGQTLRASLDFLEPTGCARLFPHHNQNFLHLTCLAVLLRHTTAREPVDTHSTAPDHKICASFRYGQPIYLGQLLVPRTDEEQLARGSACGVARPSPGK